MLFIEAPPFTRRLVSYLTDDEYRRLQEALLTNPEAGAVMPQTGGFRKLRWRDPRRGKGTRGGLRIIYKEEMRQRLDRFPTVEISDRARQRTNGATSRCSRRGSAGRAAEP